MPTQKHPSTAGPVRRAMSRFALFAVAALLAACSAIRTDFVKERSQALPPSYDTPSARYVHNEVQQHQNLSGFRLLTRSTNALMSRVALIDHAAHSIDLQYYIFDNDDTGRLVAQRLLAAAERGVRVRLLIDDLGSENGHHVFDALDAHKNIEVRRFNPFKTSHPTLPSRVAQYVLDFQRLNRRMHNKSFIVDNAVAIVGGRNIGDPYFDASTETNFSDLDVIAIGKVVAQASQAFDEYWNSDAAYPVKAFRDSHATQADLDRLRKQLQAHARAFAQSDYVQEVIDDLPNGPTADRRGQWFWGEAELVADEPEKIELAHDVPAFRIGPKIKTVMDAAQQQILMVSPYFIPGDSGVQYLTGRVAQGVAVSALTNSLAATDEPAAYAAYARYRLGLVQGGVQLFELRPAPGAPQKATVLGRSAGGVCLHAKAIVVDHRYVFVGSMNMDERSKLLNTEMGVIVDSPALAAAVAEYFRNATAPASSFAVTVAPGTDRLHWVAQNEGKQVVFEHTPGATLARKLEVAVLRLLPIEGLL